MSIDSEPTAELVDAVGRTRELIRDVVIPAETGHRRSAHATPDSRRQQLEDSMKKAQVFSPHLSPEFGGRRLDMRDRASVFEAARYSLFGPLVLNCAAPDEGNMPLLERVATADQRPSRIYDGPSETHRWAIARRMTREASRRLQVGQ